MKDLLVIIVYIGKEWPAWFDFFLESCKRNEWVDWMIFTDILKIPENQPKNCFFKYMSINGFNALAKERLGVNPTFTDPYKLCDFRIAYGVLFEEFIKNYKYWGHGDIDVVYGNLEKFVRHLLPYKYEAISFHQFRLSGCLSILRNSKNVREKFFNISDWKYVLEHPINLSRDESSFGKLFTNRNSIFQDLDPYARFCFDGTDEQKSYFNFVKEAYWNNGKCFVLIDGEEMEIPFYHFIFFLNKSFYPDPKSPAPWRLFKNIIHVDYKTYKWRINSMGFFPY